MTEGVAPLSPYETVLGAGMEELHPRLKRYFSAIPEGMVGEGSGVFEVVGTPRRWLWPILAVLARDGIVFGVWERGVAFTVLNSPTAQGSVVAEREFHFIRGARVMVDEIGVEAGSLVDTLGRSRRLVAQFSVSTPSGELHLDSTRVGIAFGGRRAWLPRPLAPRVVLVERFDDADQRQHVSVTIALPILGTVYEYAGSFTYGLRPGEWAS